MTRLFFEDGMEGVGAPDGGGETSSSSCFMRMEALFFYIKKKLNK